MDGRTGGPGRGVGCLRPTPRVPRGVPCLAAGSGLAEPFPVGFGDAAFRGRTVRDVPVGFRAEAARAGSGLGVVGFATTRWAGGVALLDWVRVALVRAVVCADGVRLGVPVRAARGVFVVAGTGAGVAFPGGREGFRDGFAEDAVAFDRDVRGFWGISGGLGIRQAGRWGSGSGRVSRPP